MQTETPNYFGILPASVRYHKGLSASAKVLYTELSALTQKEGYCWASNAYFGELYGASARSVSAWFSELQGAGFIRIEVIQDKGFKRKIWLALAENFPTYGRNLPDSSGKKLLHNNTRENTKKEEVAALPFTSDAFAKTWGEWVQFRKEKRESLTPTTTQKQFLKLKEWGELRAIAALNNSMQNGWTGIFEPKGDRYAPPPQEKRFKPAPLDSDIGIR